jgi:uncharacterized repeat protein (TIGR01451 family)
VNVNRRWLGTAVIRVRVLAVGLVLLATGCMFLRGGSRPPRLTVKPADAPAFYSSPSSLLGTALRQSATIPSFATRRIQPNPSSLMAGLPMIFEPNQGQANLNSTDTRARFIAHGSGYALLLGSEGAILNLRSKHATVESLSMKLAGANLNASVSGEDLLPGKSNYFIGNDETKWRRNVPQFARVRYENVYSGINLVFYGNQGHLEYDFQVAPGADPSQAELEFDGANATTQKDGSILIERNGAAMRLQAPRIYQTIAGREQPIDGHFILRDAHRAGFTIGAYDRTRELIIDPVLGFSSYFGGAGDEHATSVAVDSSGNIYLTGSTDSPTLPGVATGVVFQSTLKGPQNVYVAKINPVTNPAAFVYVTYLGGNGADAPAGIAVDGAGDAFVAGTTSSTNFPATGTAYQTTPEALSTGTKHVFVTELNPAATTLQYSSYLSGSGDDIATGMTIDNAGDIFVTGSTTSTKASDVGTPTGPQFPSSSLPFAIPFQSTAFASIQFFVTKVNTTNAGKASITYSTYFGGASSETSTPVVTGGGIAVDTNGNIYFDGTTNFIFTNGATGDFPILNAYQPCLNQPPPVSPQNPPVCTNATTSTQTDAFVAKINPSQNIAQGEQLQWSTYFGGTQNDSATGIAIDPGATHVFITGTTDSPGITPASGTANTAPFQECLDTPVNPPSGTACNLNLTNTDAFVTSLSNPASTSTTVNMVLNYFSYLGGTGNEQGLAITADPNDNVYLTGWTQSTDFPIAPPPGDLQSNLSGTQDAFIARLNTSTVNGQNTSGAFTSYFGKNQTVSGQAFTQGTSVALDVNANTYFAGDTNSTNLDVNALQTTNAGGFDAFVTQLKGASIIGLSGVLTLGTNQTFISAGTPATFTYTVTNNGPDPAFNLVFTDNLSTSNVTLTFVSATSTSGICSGGGTQTAVTCSIPSLEAGSTVTVVVVVTPTATGGVQSFNGGSASVSGPNVPQPFPTTQVPATMSDFSLHVSPPNNTVNVAGDSAVYQVQLKPLPVYTSSISLSCTNLPTATTCAFAPSTSITLPNASPGAATLTISTTARPITTGNAKSRLRNFYAIWLVVPGLSLLGMGITTDRRRRRILGFLMLCALFTQLLLLPACSGSTTQIPASGTPAGTYTINVVAAAGSDSKSFPIQLTVP